MTKVLVADKFEKVGTDGLLEPVHAYLFELVSHQNFGYRSAWSIPFEGVH